MEDGQAPVRVAMDTHPDPGEVAAVSLGRDLELQVLKAHAIVPPDGASDLLAQDVGEPRADERHERGARLGCYEAGFEGFWLARCLETNGYEMTVLDPSSLLVNRKARQRKTTDRIDAKKMIRALLAHDRGDSQVLSRVRVPSIAEEDRKRLLRERKRLVKQRTVDPADAEYVTFRLPPLPPEVRFDPVLCGPANPNGRPVIKRGSREKDGAVYFLGKFLFVLNSDLFSDSYVFDGDSYDI